MTSNNSAENKTDQVIKIAQAAALAAPALASTSLSIRNQTIENFAQIIDMRRAEILAANQLDGKDKDPVEFKAGRMAIDNSKIDTVIAGCQALMAMADPLGKIDYAKELDDGLNLYRVTCPIGVIGIIFEARPDVLPQIAALAIKSGNAVLLKGGQEVEQTNKVLFACLEEALQKSNLPITSAALLSSRADVAAMLKADQYVDLIIPRGSNSLVSYIQSNTKIPVLGHAEGICHIYVDQSADIDIAVKVATDSKCDYPEACNTAETLLLDTRLGAEKQSKILTALAQAGVQLKVDQTLMPLCQSFKAELAEESDWSTEYGNLTLSAKVVEGVSQAIVHINQYGSGHTDAIIGDQQSWVEFFNGVKSAGVYHNASTRFADGFRYGFGAEVGISTSKLQPRGPVGLEGLITYKYKLEGAGHIVGDYRNGRQFTHRDLKL